MIQRSTTAPDTDTWKARWIAAIRERARREVPLWHLSDAAATTGSTSPLPTTVVTPLPETGPMALRETAMISAINLLPVRVIPTRELVSIAIRAFYRKHRCWLPQAMQLHPLRCLSIPSPDFFAVECEDLGSFTIPVESNACLPSDTVLLLLQRWPWDEKAWEVYPPLGWES